MPGIRHQSHLRDVVRLEQRINLIRPFGRGVGRLVNCVFVHGFPFLDGPNILRPGLHGKTGRAKMFYENA